MPTVGFAEEKEMLWLMPLTPTASNSKHELGEILTELDNFIEEIPCAEGLVPTPIGDDTIFYSPSINGWDSESNINEWASEYPMPCYDIDYTPCSVTEGEVEDSRDIPTEWMNNLDSLPELVENFEYYLPDMGTL